MLPAALEQFGIGALVEFADRRALDQDVGLRQQVAHHGDQAVQVVLDDAVLPLVVGRNNGRNDALGNLVDVVGGDCHRFGDVLHGVVDADHQLLPAALEQFGIGSLIQLADCGALDQNIGLIQQVAHHLDQAVEVVTDDPIFAFVIGGDGVWNDALGDPVDVTGCNLQRSGHDIDNRVDFLACRSQPAFRQYFRINACIQFAVNHTV